MESLHFSKWTLECHSESGLKSGAPGRIPCRSAVAIPSGAWPFLIPCRSAWFAHRAGGSYRPARDPCLQMIHSAARVAPAWCDPRPVRPALAMPMSFRRFISSAWRPIVWIPSLNLYPAAMDYILVRGDETKLFVLLLGVGFIDMITGTELRRNPTCMFFWMAACCFLFVHLMKLTI